MRKGDTAAAFGDSIMKGVINDGVRYSLTKNSFVRLIESAAGICVLNHAQMGCTAERGELILERFAGETESEVSGCVMLGFGGNDSDFDWRSVSELPDAPQRPNATVESFRAAYRRLIERIRGLGKEPLLFSLPPIDPGKYFDWISRALDKENILRFLGSAEYLAVWHEQYNLEVFKLANETGARLIDITSCFLRLRDYGEYFCVDGIHPNERGHRLIADTVLGDGALGDVLGR